MDGNLGVWTDRQRSVIHRMTSALLAPDLHIVGVVVQAKGPALQERSGAFYAPQLTQKMISDAEASPLLFRIR